MPFMDRGGDANVNIPMTPVKSRGQVSNAGSQSTFVTHADLRKSEDKRNLFPGTGQNTSAGRRRREQSEFRRRTTEPAKLTGLGKIYDKIANFSVITRYLFYILPVSALIAVPMIVNVTAAPNAELGGVRLVWIFAWVEVVWNSLWVAKLLAKALPWMFQFICGVVSSGTRKYALVLRSLEIPLSLVGWMLCSWLTFIPMMTRNPDQRKQAGGTATQPWEERLNKVLAAALCSFLILLLEKLIIQLLSINYHRTQFNDKIKDSKRNIHLISMMYEASRRIFPAYCSEFAQEDYIINDSIVIGNDAKHKRSGSATPMKLIRDVGRVGDKITAAFGNMAHEITGKQVFNPTSAHSIVVEALEKHRSSEALAKRIWMSFVSEGRDELVLTDVHEVLGGDKEAEADECFDLLDKDGNGDVSLEEMIMTVVECGRTRRTLANSMHDVDQAINVLDNVLSLVVFIVCIFIFLAFLNASFVTTLATAGTALLSLSFVFSVTAQELLGSCIFLFVKHPFDVGDRVDIADAKLVVEHISLLFTVFKRVDTGKSVQVPNIVLNAVWIENISRSKAMKETVTIPVDFGTSFEDVMLLKQLMLDFVRSKENARDFQPDIDIDILDINGLSQMNLKMEIRHKSNWSNGALAGARRAKFMTALVQAVRKVPINGPGGGDVPLGDPKNPSYSVAVSNDAAVKNREEFLADKESHRYINAVNLDNEENGKSSGLDNSSNNTILRSRTVDSNSNLGQPGTVLNSTNNPGSGLAAYDESRDDLQTIQRETRASHERRASIDEVRDLLRRESTRGRRKKDATADNMFSQDAIAEENQYPAQYPKRKESLRGRDPAVSSGALGRYQTNSSIQSSNFNGPPSVQSQAIGSSLYQPYSGSSANTGMSNMGGPLGPAIPSSTPSNDRSSFEQQIDRIQGGPPPAPSSRYAGGPSGPPPAAAPPTPQTLQAYNDIPDVPQASRTPPAQRRPIPGQYNRRVESGSGSELQYQQNPLGQQPPPGVISRQRQSSLSDAGNSSNNLQSRPS
jgi:small-conductance mechanosensitive channel